MLPGRFLCIARTTGDAFTFYILTKSEKGRDVILTRSVVRKHLQDAPQTFAVYPDQEERAEESLIAQVDRLSFLQVLKNEHNKVLSVGWLKYNQMGPSYCWREMTECTKKWLRDLKLCEAEEIIIGNQRATYEGTDEGTGDVILHMEVGSYKTLSTEEV